MTSWLWASFLGPKLRLGPHFPEALLRGIMASMTRSRYRIFETEYPYFLTNTIVGWLPVFTRPEAVDIPYDSWRHRQRQRGLMIFGYGHPRKPLASDCIGP